MKGGSPHQIVSEQTATIESISPFYFSRVPRKSFRQLNDVPLEWRPWPSRRLSFTLLAPLVPLGLGSLPPPRLDFHYDTNIHKPEQAIEKKRIRE